MRGLFRSNPKPVHKAKLVSQTGRVSPLCAETPRALNLSRSAWTLRAEDVTCPRCIKLLPARGEKGKGNR